MDEIAKNAFYASLDYALQDFRRAAITGFQESFSFGRVGGLLSGGFLLDALTEQEYVFWSEVTTAWRTWSSGRVG